MIWRSNSALTLGSPFGFGWRFCETAFSAEFTSPTYTGSSFTVAAIGGKSTGGFSSCASECAPEPNRNSSSQQQRHDDVFIDGRQFVRRKLLRVTADRETRSPLALQES